MAGQRGAEVWFDLAQRFWRGDVIVVQEYAVQEKIHQRTARARMDKASASPVFSLVAVEVEVQSASSSRRGRKGRLGFCMLDVAIKKNLRILEV